MCGLPGIAGALGQDTVVEPAGLALPELELVDVNAVPTPCRRARDINTLEPGRGQAARHGR